MRWVGDISMSFYMVHLLIWDWAVKIRKNNIPDKTEAPPVDSSVLPDIHFVGMASDDPFRKTCSENGAPSFSNRQRII